MAKYFRQVTSDLNLRPIYFLPPTIYKLNTPFNGAHYLYAEPLIDVEQWTKYTNNYQLCKSPTMASFSHFTHQMSKGYFMITDLQGTGSLLSDPAIHSTDMEQFKETTNLGKQGIDTFFTSPVGHPNCNSDVCKKIGLSHPYDSKFIDEAKSSLLTVEDHEQVDIVCELCSQLDHVDFKTYKIRIEDSESSFTACEDCHAKLQKKQVGACSIRGCSNTFEWTPFFYQIMGFSTLPNKCIPCNSSVEADCKRCKKAETLKYWIWGKQTHGGRLQFLCKGCVSYREDYREPIERKMMGSNRGTESKKVSSGPRAPRQGNFFVEEEKKSEAPEEVKAKKTWLDRYHIQLDKVQELVDSDEECPSPAKVPKIKKAERIKPNLRAIIPEEKKMSELPKRPTTTKEVLQMELDEKKKSKRSRKRAANKKTEEVSDIKMAFKW